MNGEPGATGEPLRRSWLRAVFSRAVLRNLGMWTLVEFTFVFLSLTLMGVLWIDGKFDWDGFGLMVSLAGLGFIYGFGIVVLPCAIVSVLRLRRRPPRRMHYVLYFATVICLIAMIPLVGIFFIFYLIPQLIATVVLHVLMARHYRRCLRE